MLLPLLTLALQSPQLYSEPLRPQFHFTPQKGWMNDPNGLVYSKGEYHLFFQHNPTSTQWNDMHWGHAVSKDLVHWKQLPEAIAPDELGTIWSGSAVVDKLNTAGFGKSALICIYTAAGNTSEASKGKTFTQCLTYSLDRVNFTKFSGNPVLQQIHDGNRDPKLNWYEPTHSWVLALYLEGNHYGLFRSKDLKSWTRTDTVDMPNASECPDFFEMPIDGNPANKKWVFWGASGFYRVGAYDGEKFSPETDSIPTDLGNAGYASQTFFNTPKGRRIQIAWFRDSQFPGCAWNQQMGFPSELHLRSTSDGPRLTYEPVDEIKNLRVNEIEGMDGWYPSQNGLMDIDFHAKAPASGSLVLTVNGIDVHYDASTQKLSCLDKAADAKPIDGVLDIRILADRASIEIYANEGLVYMPMFVIPDGISNGLRVTKEGDWGNGKLRVYQLKSAWH